MSLLAVLPIPTACARDIGATPTTQFAISAIGSAKTPRSPLFPVVGDAGVGTRYMLEVLPDETVIDGEVVALD